jgi:hypothetical protein
VYLLDLGVMNRIIDCLYVYLLDLGVRNRIIDCLYVYLLDFLCATHDLLFLVQLLFHS